MKRGLITGLVGAAVALFVGAYALSPVFAAQALVHAAKTGDEDALHRLVDFPAFRASVKEELNAALLAEMRDRGGDVGGTLASLGMLLAPSLVSGAVDAFVTPGAIASMVRTAEAPNPADRSRPDHEAKADAEADEGDDIHQAWGYRNLDTFAVTLTRRDTPDDHLALLLERRGLFSWKLAGLDLDSGANAPG